MCDHERLEEVGRPGPWVRCYDCGEELDLDPGTAPPDGFKVCGCCQSILRLARFGRRSASSDGRDSICYRCRRGARQTALREERLGVGGPVSFDDYFGSTEKAREALADLGFQQNGDRLWVYVGSEVPF